jgi:adenine-specific DNA-methyltransferase
MLLINISMKFIDKSNDLILMFTIKEVKVVLKTSKEQLIKELQMRVEDKILESTNYELLKKLIEKADTINEAIAIYELGTTYKRTGFHFDKRLDKIMMTDIIRYFIKNEQLSFVTDKSRLTHKLIIGDNYPALLNLMIQYRGAVDVIYIDPPYGKDKMGEFAKTNYNNAITRDNLLSMLFPRLLLAKSLLAEDGFIFCSIDDRNYAYVKCLFDEIFTEKCFINTFVWKKNSSGKTEKDKFTTNTEYILFYSKTDRYTLNDTYKELAESTKAMYNRDDGDGRGKYRLIPLQKPANPGPETTYDYVDNLGRIWPCPPKGWRMTKEKLKLLENDNRLHFDLVNKTLNEKGYWDERKNPGKRIDTLWNDLPENSTASKELEKIFNLKGIFDNPKPTELIKRCIDIGPKNAVVLDFFAGSGTTGQATLELNRQDDGNRTFILVQNNEITDTTPNGIAYDVTVKRLKRVMTGSCYDGTNDFEWLKDNEPLGDNLDVYENEEISSFRAVEGKTPFDLIDETLYGQEKFKSIKEKIEWVCENFEITQRKLVED